MSDLKTKLAASEAECERLKAEVGMLRGEDCLVDGDGPCGVCIKCLRLRAEAAEAARDEALEARHFCDSCGREGKDVEAEICRHCLTHVDDLYKEEKQKLAALSQLARILIDKCEGEKVTASTTQTCDAIRVLLREENHAPRDEQAS